MAKELLLVKGDFIFERHTRLNSEVHGINSIPRPFILLYQNAFTDHYFLNSVSTESHYLRGEQVSLHKIDDDSSSIVKSQLKKLIEGNPPYIVLTIPHGEEIIKASCKNLGIIVKDTDLGNLPTHQ
jgi:hypothetical protein